jgi:hypothetical protein
MAGAELNLFARDIITIVVPPTYARRVFSKSGNVVFGAEQTDQSLQLEVAGLDLTPIGNA